MATKEVATDVSLSDIFGEAFTPTPIPAPLSAPVSHSTEQEGTVPAAPVPVQPVKGQASGWKQRLGELHKEWIAPATSAVGDWLASGLQEFEKRDKQHKLALKEYEIRLRNNEEIPPELFERVMAPYMAWAFPGTGLGNPREIFKRGLTQAERLVAAGVQPTIGQAKEGLAGKIAGVIEPWLAKFPLTGMPVRAAQKRAAGPEFNLATLNQVRPPGMGKLAEPGSEAIESIRQGYTSAYGDLYKGEIIKPKMQFANVVRKTLDDPTTMLNEAEQKSLQNLVDTLITQRYQQALKTTGKAELPGEVAQKIRSDLSQAAVNATNANLQKAITNIRKGWDQAMESQLTPIKRGKAQQLNRQYSKWKRVEDAIAKQTEEGAMFTPQQLASSVLKMSKPSHGKTAYARGEAPMSEWAKAGAGVLKTVEQNPWYFAMETGLGAFNPALLVAPAATAALYSRAGQKLLSRPYGALNTVAQYVGLPLTLRQQMGPTEENQAP